MELKQRCIKPKKQYVFHKSSKKPAKIGDIFDDFKKRYGLQHLRSQNKLKNQFVYQQKSHVTINKFNQTQFSYQRDISEIRHNIEAMKAGQQKSLYNLERLNQKNNRLQNQKQQNQSIIQPYQRIIYQRWQPIPQKLKIDYTRLDNLEKMLQNYLVDSQSENKQIQITI